MDNKCVKSETQCSEEETSAAIKEFNKRCNINSSNPELNPEDYISEKMFPDKIECDALSQPDGNVGGGTRKRKSRRNKRKSRHAKKRKSMRRAKTRKIYLVVHEEADGKLYYNNIL